jgi:hypothetical protein
MATAKSSARLHSSVARPPGAGFASLASFPPQFGAFYKGSTRLVAGAPYESRMFLVDDYATYIGMHSGQRSVLLEEEFYQRILPFRCFRM